MMPCRTGSRRGFSLIELIVGVVLLGIIAGTAVAFLMRQNRSYADTSGRFETVQNLRYALQRLETDLVTVGTHLVPGQPAIVYAAGDMIAFHADFATNIPNDPFAVFYTPGAPAGQVQTPTTPLTLPTTAVSYPATVYLAGPGIPSPAELITLYFQPDDLSGNDDDFMLLRQVNNAAPEVVARDLRRIGTEPFFRYFRIRLEAGVGLVLDSIPAADLPVAHPEAGGATELADSIRGVRVQLASASPVRNVETPEVSVSRAVRFPNADRTAAALPLCGTNPILGVPLLGSVMGTGPGGTAPYEVLLEWDPAVDEAGGEQDVLRYLIWRRVAGELDWGDPYRSIPSGATSPSWRDVNVQPGETYEYALAAQDCTPSLSELAFSSPQMIPLT